MYRGTLPHICIDATSILPDGKGAAVYALSLLQALHALDLPGYFTILIRREATASLGACLKPSHPNWSIQAVNVKSAHVWHLVSLPCLLQHLKPDLLHVLGEAALGWLPVPYLLSVHELPHLYRWWVGQPSNTLYSRVSQGITEILFPGACRRASGILALSQSTASDLVQHYRVQLENISVAYPAANSTFFEASHYSCSDWCQSLPHPYVLTFATGDRREVPEQVVQAFGLIFSQVPHHLVIAGRCPDWQKSILLNLSRQVGCSERLYFTGFVPAQDLPVVYRNADVYIEMSRYEGFGLQVCEAMATGTVAIASNVASLPEIIGKAGYLVELYDSVTLANRLAMLLTDQAERHRQSLAAIQQAQTFSWDQCARIAWITIERILSDTLSHRNF